MRSLLILSFFGISHAFKPADLTALKAAVDDCVNDQAFNHPHLADGSVCYTCLDGTMKASAEVCAAGDTAQFITDWDTSLITSMLNLFKYKSAFNQPLNWDVSSVTNFQYTFGMCEDFDQDISSWDVSKGTNFGGMFSGGSSTTTTFNQDISSWDVSSATRMNGMFMSNTAFDQDISAWDVSLVSIFHSMFKNSPFNQDISCWDTSSATLFTNMFKDSSMSKTLCWDTGSATTTDMFTGSTGSVDSTCTRACAKDGAACSADSECISGACSTTCQPRCKENEHVSSGSCQACAAGKLRPAGDDPAGTDTACETPRFKPADRAALKAAVDACVDGTSYGPSTKDGSECYACLDGTMVTSASASCSDGSIPTFITDWDTSLVTNMNDLFYYKRKFNTDISSWDTSSVTYMAQTFRSSTDFNQPLNWDTSSVTNFYNMFLDTSAFNQDISPWDTSSVGNFYGMFQNSLFDQDISCWDTSSATSYNRMFMGSSMSKTLCWDTGSVSTTDMFTGTTGSVDSCTAACTADGAACSADSECVSGVCNTGTCVPPTCAENEHASGGSCLACAAGKTNAAGDPVASDSACDSTLCQEDHHVVSNACQSCAQGKRPAGDDASGADTECEMGPCGGFTCSENSNCVNSVCACNTGYSGMECTRHVTAEGRSAMLAQSRKSIPTKEDIKETQRNIKSFIADTLEKELLTKSLKDAIRDTKITVAYGDLPINARVIALQVQKSPVIAVSPKNKDIQDTCKQGLNTASCAMLDIKESPGEVVFLNTQEEAGSWSVLNSASKIISKQTRVSEDVYDMQCWAEQVIFVDAGVESGDFYNFYTDKACSNKIDKDADGSYHLNKETKYTFARCASATSHPFEVYPTGTSPAEVGISGDETKSVQSGDLTWVCTSHTAMTGTFKAVGDADWSEKVRFDTSSDSGMYDCSGHVILIGSQAAVCTDDTCKNGGICTTDGYSFTCSCPSGYTGSTCENAAVTHCHQIDCSDYGGHSTDACTECTVANCCNYASKTLFNTLCDSLSLAQAYVDTKCCQRNQCL